MSKPKYMDRHEIHKMRVDGDKLRKARGEYHDLSGAASSIIVGPDGHPIGQSTLTRNQRKHAGVLIATAIESMANGEFATWHDCLNSLQEVLTKGGWQHEQVMGLMKEIETEAISDSGNPALGQVARKWLYQKKQEILH
jgi:hypothetical protein